MNQLLENGEYDVVANMKKPPKTVLDAGSNFGLGTLIFATMWPNARIVAVEVAESNFQVLTKNVGLYPNVVAFKAGLWWRVARLALMEGNRTPGAREWGFMVDEVDNIPQERRLETLTAVSVPFLCNVLAIPGFEYIKMDIEGSEKEVFTEKPADGYNLKWLDYLRLATVELHSDMRPGAQETVEAAFKKKAFFEPGRSGEYFTWTTRNA
eukprot:jgi/Mesen1/5139/ME000255S04108